VAVCGCDYFWLGLRPVLAFETSILSAISYVFYMFFHMALFSLGPAFATGLIHKYYFEASRMNEESYINLQLPTAF